MDFYFIQLGIPPDWRECIVDTVLRKSGINYTVAPYHACIVSAVGLWTSQHYNMDFYIIFKKPYKLDITCRSQYI